MYKKEELLNKVKGHLKGKDDMKLLESLISDLDDFNFRYGNSFTEIYIDFDDVGSDVELDPYETFSVKIHDKSGLDDKNTIRVVHGGLDIHQLDDCLCMLEEYFEETREAMDNIDVKLSKDNEELYEKIKSASTEGKMMYQKCFKQYATVDLEEFTRKPLEEQLYDINRFKKIILMTKNLGWSEFSRRWVNDLALLTLLEYYYNKCKEYEKDKLEG